MAIFRMMVGLPGSGKDYYISQNKKDTDVVLSSDGIRAELGDVNDQSQNEKVFGILYDRMRQAIADGKDIWFNATNVTIKNRKQALDMVRNRNYEVVAVVIATPVEKCIAQDKQRDRNVGEEVIQKFVSRFQMPVYGEGFTDIIVVGNNEPLDMVKACIMMRNTEQTSKWHKENVYEHACMVNDLFNYNSRQMYVFFHDIGKVFTQTKDEKGYHFKTHENVGAYYLLTHPIYGEVDLDGIFLVNYHMLMKRDCKPETLAKYKRLFGDEKFELLMRFCKADEEGTIREI